MNDPASPIQQVLDVFAQELRDVRFGDVDAASLAQLAAEVDALAAEVADATRKLEAARDALRSRSDTLTETATRALAYARVYAERDEALSARLDAIPLGRGTKRPRGETDAALRLTDDLAPPKRPRGRPRKTPPPPPVMLHALPLAPLTLEAE